MNAARRAAIRNRTENGSGNQLGQIGGAAVDITAREVRIRFFQIGRAHFVARQNAIAKTGREPLDLRFDSFRHVDLATKRNMAISPKGVLSARRARFVKETLLRDQHEWTLWNFAARDIALCARNFLNRSAEMNGPGTPALF